MNTLMFRVPIMAWLFTMRERIVLIQRYLLSGLIFSSGCFVLLPQFSYSYEFELPRNPLAYTSEYFTVKKEKYGSCSTAAVLIIESQLNLLETEESDLKDKVKYMETQFGKNVDGEFYIFNRSNVIDTLKNDGYLVQSHNFSNRNNAAEHQSFKKTLINIIKKKHWAFIISPHNMSNDEYNHFYPIFEVDIRRESIDELGLVQVHMIDSYYNKEVNFTVQKIIDSINDTVNNQDADDDLRLVIIEVYRPDPYQKFYESFIAEEHDGFVQLGRPHKKANILGNSNIWIQKFYNNSAVDSNPFAALILSKDGNQYSTPYVVKGDFLDWYLKNDGQNKLGVPLADEYEYPTSSETLKFQQFENGCIGYYPKTFIDKPDNSLKPENLDIQSGVNSISSQFCEKILKCQFRDMTTNDSASNSAKKLCELGIVSGYKDKVRGGRKFGFEEEKYQVEDDIFSEKYDEDKDRSISRIELLKMVLLAKAVAETDLATAKSKYECVEGKPSASEDKCDLPKQHNSTAFTDESTFEKKDGDKTNIFWSYAYVNKAVKDKIMQGNKIKIVMQDNSEEYKFEYKFAPNKFITRSEAMKPLMKAYCLDEKATQGSKDPIYRKRCGVSAAQSLICTIEKAKDIGMITEEQYKEYDEREVDNYDNGLCGYASLAHSNGFLEDYVDDFINKGLDYWNNKLTRKEMALSTCRLYAKLAKKPNNFCD